MNETKTPLFFFKLAITGGFRRGKDTLAEVVKGLFVDEAQEYIVSLAFAEALKREHAAMTYNWLKRSDDFEQYVDWMKARRDINGVGWQWWGEFRRQVYGEDYWVKHPMLQRHFEVANYHRWPIVMTDMRHHNEAEWCKSQGFFRLRVEGPCRAPGDVRDVDHPSERDIEKLDVDITVENVWPSTDGLRKWAKRILLPALREHQDKEDQARGNWQRHLDSVNSGAALPDGVTLNLSQTGALTPKTEETYGL